MSLCDRVPPMCLSLWVGRKRKRGNRKKGKKKQRNKRDKKNKGIVYKRSLCVQLCVGVVFVCLLMIRETKEKIKHEDRDRSRETTETRGKKEKERECKGG